MKKIIFFACFFFYLNSAFSEILVFKNCTSEEYDFEKNEYSLNIKKGIMTREYVYTDETYKRLRMNDARIEKENTSTKGIAKIDGEIISDISGYPAFYTQLIFNKKKANIKIRTVLNNTKGESLLSQCETVINYKKES